MDARNAIAGVGITPAHRTLTPIEEIPAARAASSISPETRVSFPMTMDEKPLFCCFIKKASARPVFMAMTGVMGYLFATPLIPSVPNNFFI